jgi:hypothetical protein
MKLIEASQGCFTISMPLSSTGIELMSDHGLSMPPAARAIQLARGANCSGSMLWLRWKTLSGS